MCGIFGMFSTKKKVSHELLKRALKEIEHRGPDGNKTWVGWNSQVGLGHTRLSIIDLHSGTQPIPNEDETTHIVANGEFYEFERTRKMLIDKGHKFRTGSDSEIALHLYEDYGANCLSHLRGEFAFAIWDDKNKQMFAARDRFGIKPLYYTMHEGSLYFASEAKALIAAGVPAEWDREYLFHQASSGIYLPNRTFFKGIFQVPAGSYILATENSFQIHQYWDMTYPKISERRETLTDQEWIERFRFELEEAVRIRMRADVPVCAFLSGGLDSCSIIGLATKHTDVPIHAFTIAFDHESFNEEKIAREMAAFCGAKFNPISVKQQDLADSFSDFIWHIESTILNGHGIATYILSKNVRDAGYKVALTGQGSDELLFGYAGFKLDMLRNGSASKAEQENMLRELKSKNEASMGWILPSGEARDTSGVQKALGFVPAWLETGATIGHKLHSVMNSEIVSEFGMRDPFRLYLDSIVFQSALSGREFVDQSAYLYGRTMLPNYVITVTADRPEMAHSVEGRPPFLDHKLAELAFKIPPHLKIHNMTEKYILREAVKPVVTDTIYNRKKHPFSSPPATFNPKQKMSQLMNSMFRSDALKDIGMFNQTKVVELTDKIMKSEDETLKQSYDSAFLTLMSLCLLKQRFNL